MLGVAFADDRMRAFGHATHHLAALERIALNLIRLDPIIRKDGVKTRRFTAATSSHQREHVFRLAYFYAIALQ